jgi:hypothetical protein
MCAVGVGFSFPIEIYTSCHSEQSEEFVMLRITNLKLSFFKTTTNRSFLRQDDIQLISNPPDRILTLRS